MIQMQGPDTETTETMGHDVNVKASASNTI